MLASRQPSLTSVRRDAWVEVDLGALTSNLRVVRSWLKAGTSLMAVVKSDAYGHGAPSVAPVLLAAGAHSLGVASVDEGMQLREAGIKAPVLILSPCPFWALGNAIDNDLDITVTHKSELADFGKAAKQSGKVARVHVKVDTGMHRLGGKTGEALEIVNAVANDKTLKLAGFFSHLAAADDQARTAEQNIRFQSVLKDLAASKARPGQVHLASGEAARRFPDTHYDMVRVGLYLYGLEPSVVSQVVTPALSIRARINHMQTIGEGESVGYSLTWTAARPTRLASIPVGYADGVDRRLSNRMCGLINGKQVRQVGLISMDQMLFDITDAPEAQPGDIITLIGWDNSTEPGVHRPQALHLATWATMLDTITYELACRLRVRLPRIYTRAKQTPGTTTQV